MLRASRLERSVLLVLVIAGAAVTMFPLWWLAVSSFTPETLVYKQLGIWPTEFTLENYIGGWKGFSSLSFGVFFKNSFLLVGARIIGTVISSSLAAFAFARLEFTGRKPLFAVMILLMMLPFHVTLIPRYIMFFRLGWVDSYKPLVIPTFFATQGFFIFLMVQFMRTLPRELDEAAICDGCSPFGIYWHIMLPLIQPALVTAAIFTFIWSWNDFFSNLIYISNPRLFTVALGLRAFVDATSGTAFGAMFAMALLSLIPVFIFFVSAQRLLIEGIATTGLKG